MKIQFMATKYPKHVETTRVYFEVLHMVVRVGTVGSYALSKTDGTVVPKIWNAMHLKKYYQ